MKRWIYILALICVTSAMYSFDIVLIKYRAGDWYNARQAVQNLLVEAKKRTTIRVKMKVPELSLDDERIFEHPFLFINGHVPLKLNDKEKLYLRKYVLGGGFVLINDDYGMDKSVKALIKEVFPDNRFEEVGFKHPVYRSFYKIVGGLPKIHEHDGGAAKGYGLFIKGRIAIYYAANSDIADGWDYYEVHKDPPEKREAAFRMGINIIVYSLTH